MAGHGPSPLGLLRNGARARPLTAALRHTSRAGDITTSDRYTIIRSFFARTHTAPTPAHRISQNAKACLYPPSGPLARRAALTSSAIGVRTRLFHASITWRSDNDAKAHPQPAAREPGGSTPSEHPASQSSEPSPPRPPDPPPNLENYSSFFRRLALSLPHLHRPTRDDFLNVAGGFWERMRVRFKWFTIRSFRRFNADDMSAFVSLLLLSQTVWILVGT